MLLYLGLKPGTPLRSDLSVRKLSHESNQLMLVYSFTLYAEWKPCCAVLSASTL